MSGEKTLKDLSPEDTQARQWLLQYLDLSGSSSGGKPKQDPGPRSKATEDMQPGQEATSTFKDDLPRMKAVLERLNRLKLPSDATPRQVEALNQLLEPAKQLARDGKLDDAEQAAGRCEELYRVELQRILTRRERVEQLAKLKAANPIHSFTKGQGQRLRDADADYLKAVEADQPNFENDVKAKREQIQEDLKTEVERGNTIRTTAASLTAPPESLTTEVEHLEGLRTKIEEHRRNDRLDDAEGELTALKESIETIKKQVTADKAKGKELAKGLLASIQTFAKDLSGSGLPYVEPAGLSDALRFDKNGALLKSNDALIHACAEGTATRQQALDLARDHAAIEQSITDASQSVTESVSQARTAIPLIEGALSRARETLDKLKVDRKLDYMPKLWAQWPRTVTKPRLSELANPPDTSELDEKYYKYDNSLKSGIERLKKTAGVGGKPALNWTLAMTAAEKLATDVNELYKGYFATLKKAVYAAFAKAKQDKTEELKSTMERINAALSKRGMQSVDDVRKELAPSDQTVLDQITKLTAPGASISKVKTKVEAHFQSEQDALTDSDNKVTDLGKTDGQPQEPVVTDPTVFEDVKDYKLVGQLLGKPLYARFDFDVHNTYDVAMKAGVIPSTSTGKAGIKNEPYGWVVKVTRAAATANQEVDNTQSPIASAGLKVSTGDTPAFYLNFDKWVSRH